MLCKEQESCGPTVKIEKLHVIIYTECDDVKGRTNDGALSLLEAFPLGSSRLQEVLLTGIFFSFSLIHNVTVNPAWRGLMLQGCF